MPLTDDDACSRWTAGQCFAASSTVVVRRQQPVRVELGTLADARIGDVVMVRGRVGANQYKTALIKSRACLCRSV